MAAASSCGSTTPTGSGRSEAHAEAIREDLAWLGLAADEEHRQSARFGRYEAAFERLRAAGRVYPAYETAQELDLKRKVQLGRGKPPVYDRAALALTDAERARLEAEGRRPHWRFRLDHDAPIEWDDLIRGRQHFDPALLSDPVVRREDGSWLYMLPSIVDDIDMGVTHVVRGEDHVTNTALQIQMFEALGAPPPAFAHEALLVGSEGKLSKRLGSLGVEALREAGIEPIALVAKLARIGTSLPVEPVADPAPLIESVRLRHLRPGAGAVRHGRARRSSTRGSSTSCRSRRSAARLPAGHGRGGLGGDPAQSEDASPKPPTGGTSSTAMSSARRRRRTGLPRGRGRGGGSGSTGRCALAAARRRASRRRPAGPARRCSGRCGWRSPAATAARKWRPCCR